MKLARYQPVPIGMGESGLFPVPAGRRGLIVSRIELEVANTLFPWSSTRGACTQQPPTTSAFHP